VSDTILDKVAAGNPGAVEQCLSRYGGLVWSLARRLSPTTSDAEDAVQEIFVDLWRHASRFNPRKESSEAAFIAMIARRRLIDRHRKHSRQARTMPMDATLLMPAATPTKGIDLRDEAGRVRELLGRLRSEEQKVLELIFFQGLSQAAVSELLDMPLGTVKTHSRRGLIRLRELSADAMDIERKGE
jgi:RNA polymerase sigma factor (sigma-70 family)